MILSIEELERIREEIVEGVDLAKNEGVDCDYPDSFIVTNIDESGIAASVSVCIS